MNFTVWKILFFFGQLEDHRKSFILCEQQCLRTAGIIASKVLYFVTHTCEQESKNYFFVIVPVKGQEDCLSAYHICDLWC